MQLSLDEFISKLLLIDNITPLTPSEEKLLTPKGMNNLILSRLTSAKFRKTSMNAYTASAIKKYLVRVTDDLQPVKLTILFGGYKQARLTSFPYPDWAEIFNINFNLKCASYIESVYSPGVEIIYRSDELVAKFLDDYTNEDLAKYLEKFRDMIKLLNSKIPSRRKISLTWQSASETSPPKKLFRLMKKLYPKHARKFDALSFDQKKIAIWKSIRNHNLPVETYKSELDFGRQYKHFKWAYIMHQAFLEADVQTAKDFYNNCVPIVLRARIPGTIHFGSCSASTVQFWVGEGFIEPKETRFIPRILSYGQQEKTKFKIEKVNVPEFNKLGLDKIKLIKMSSLGNFKQLNGSSTPLSLNHYLETFNNLMQAYKGFHWI